jgi:predicted transcriptional regulator
VTKRNGKAKHSPPSPLEQAVLDFLWTNGPCTADAVREGLMPRHELKDPTVRTLLRRLEQKGYAAHEEQGRTYLWRALERRRSLAARLLREVADRFCHGSVEELVTAMVEDEVIDPRELRELARRLERERDGRK